MRSGSSAIALLLCLVFAAQGPRAEEQVAQVPSPAPARVTLQFQGMEIAEVLKILAEQTGFNIVAGRNVSGRVTLFVKDVDPWEALEVILAANELAYERQGEILTIMTQRDYELINGQPYRDRRVLKSITPRHAKAADLARALTQVKTNIGRVVADEATNTLILMDTPALVERMAQMVREMDRPVETRVFSLNHSGVKALAPLLQEAVTKGVGRVLPDERSNQVAVTDYPFRLEEIGRMVAAFDERPSEVLIDAKIIQVVLSDKFQLGINWEAVEKENVAVMGLGALNLTSGSQLKVTKAALSRRWDFTALVEALRTFGDTQILSEPRLTVMNNQEAKILVGSKEPYVTTQVSQTGTGTALTAETVNFIDVGVKLFVTPTIARDGFVSMKIRPEVSSKTGSLTTANKNEIPIVETAEVETVLMVKDGETVILGGLIKDEDTKDHQRIPLLGDIPGLGLLFRSTKETEKRTELVVFLTPRILYGAGGGGASAPPVLPEGADPKAYQRAIEGLIETVARVQSLVTPEKGIAVVSFILTPNGRVDGAPQMAWADDEALGSPARQAVLAASPFPPFPPEWGGEARSFEVQVAYE